ncbi:MAG: ferrous iron transport protein A [Anaerolineae bacterium]|nr:ferrous iron transport protein A [Anaerolineae bacterium]
METRTLDTLSRHQTAVVTALHSDGAERRRMMDLGIVPGTAIRVEMVSPLGDPVAYLVRGSVVALRREQAAKIEITLQPAEETQP